MDKVPLVDWQGHVEAEEELVFGEEDWYVAHYRFVEAACRHEGVQALVKLFLGFVVRGFCGVR